jgi:hypothetical protein
MTDTSPDAYATLTGLVALLADGKATVKRIDELRKLEDRIAAAQAKLDADTAPFEATKAALEAREAAVRDREERVDAAEKKWILAQPIDRFAPSPNLDPGGMSHSGLTREAYRS